MRSSGSFDRVADRCDATRGGEERGREFAANVTPHLVPGPVLEVGIGTGVVAGGLRDLGRRVGGIDVSPLMAKRAYERVGPVVALGDSRALPVRDGAVANVLFSMVLHLDRPRPWVNPAPADCVQCLSAAHTSSAMSAGGRPSVTTVMVATSW